MSDKILSQEELDALLSGGIDNIDSEEEALEEDGVCDIDVEDALTDVEIDALGEIGNISMGTAATTLSTLLGKKVSITTPEVTITTPECLAREYDAPIIAVDVSYKEGFKASNVMMLKTDDAKTITDLMMGKTEVDLDREISEMDLSAVSEAMNQMMGSAATSMSEMFNTRIDIKPPVSKEITIEEGLETFYVLKDKNAIAKISFDMEIEDYLDSNIMQLIPIDFGKEMVSRLMDGPVAEEDSSEEIEIPEKEIETNDVINDIIEEEVDEPKVEVQKPTASQSSEVIREEPERVDMSEKVVVKKPKLQSFDNQPQVSNGSEIDLVGDIPIELTVELGRTSKTIGEVLKFGVGTVVELDNLVGEPLNIYANGKLIANGEVVVIDDNFGVRITEVDSNNKKLV